MATNKRVRVSELPVVILDTVLPEPGSMNEIPLSYVEDFQNKAASNLFLGKTVTVEPCVEPYGCNKCVTRNPVVVFTPEVSATSPTRDQLTSSKTLIVIHAETDSPALAFLDGRTHPFVDGTTIDDGGWARIHHLVIRYGWRLLVSANFAELTEGRERLASLVLFSGGTMEAFGNAPAISITGGDAINLILACPRAFTTTRATTAQTIQSRLPTTFARNDAVDSTRGCDVLKAVKARFPDRIRDKMGVTDESTLSMLGAVGDAKLQDFNFPTYIPPPNGDFDAADADAVEAFRIEVVVNAAVRKLASLTDSFTGQPVSKVDRDAVTLHTNTSIAVTETLGDYVDVANVNDVVMGRNGAFTSPASACDGCGCNCATMNDALTDALGVFGKDARRLKFWACASCTPTILVDGMSANAEHRTTRFVAVPNSLGCAIVSDDPDSDALRIPVFPFGDSLGILFKRVWPCLFTGKIDVTEYGDATWERRDALAGLECTDDTHRFVRPDLLGINAKLSHSSSPDATPEDVATPCTACVISRVMDGTAAICLGCQVPVTALDGVGGVSTHFRHACLCDGTGKVVVCDTCAIPNAHTGLVCAHPGCSTAVHAECGGVVYKPEPESSEVENFALCGAHVGHYVRDIPDAPEREIDVVRIASCCATSFTDCGSDAHDSRADHDTARIVAFHDFDAASCRGVCCVATEGNTPACVGAGLFCRNADAMVNALGLHPWSVDGYHGDEDAETVVAMSLSAFLCTRYIAPCGHIIAAATDDPRQFTSCSFSRVNDVDPCETNPDAIPYMQKRHLDIAVPLKSPFGRVHVVHILILKTDHAPVFSARHRVDDRVAGVASNVEDLLESLMDTSVAICGEPFVFENADIPVYVRDRVAGRLMITVRGTAEDVNAAIRNINGIGLNVTQRRIPSPSAAAAPAIDPVAFVSSTLPAFRIAASGVALDAFLERVNDKQCDDPYIPSDSVPRRFCPPPTPLMAGVGVSIPRLKGHIRSLIDDLEAAATESESVLGSKRPHTQ